MIKIQCENPICGASFFYNETKNPNAKKVVCPKCKAIQLIPDLATPTPAVEEEEDWLRRDVPEVSHSPQVEVEKFPPPAKPVADEYQEDFFTTPPKRTTPNAPILPRPELNDGPVGWLVIHDENTATQTFNLQLGINKIGRKSHNSPKDINIGIATEDKYMSRYHCDLEVKWLASQHRYNYTLIDRNSTNGTFVNASKKLRQTDQIPLNDGDIIQIGRTKVVLKLPTTVRSSGEAENWVRSTDHFKTIIQ